MNMLPHLEEFGRLVGDTSRATMLSALMDGRAWTGGELASFAHVAPSTASSHLGRLVRGGLLTVLPQGRHRHYRIASPAVANALESLMLLIPVPAPRHDSQRRIAADIAAARLCYDHLAGKLGVAVADALIAHGAVAITEASASVTPEGLALFERIGVSLEKGRSRRPMCRSCLDWSERRPHVAGTLGAALAKAALERNWVRRKPGTRALIVTPRGFVEFRDLLRVDCSGVIAAE